MTLKLTNGHLIIDRSVVADLFEGMSYVRVVYYPSNHTLMIAQDHDEVFKALHKSKALLLKDKNPAGDKSVSLREILMDFDLDDTDRAPGFHMDKQMKVLKVYLS